MIADIEKVVSKRIESGYKDDSSKHAFLDIMRFPLWGTKRNIVQWSTKLKVENRRVRHWLQKRSR